MVCHRDGRTTPAKKPVVVGRDSCPLKLLASSHTQYALGEKSSRLDAQITGGLEDYGKHHGERINMTVQKLQVALLSLVFPHAVCCCKKSVGATSCRATINIGVACGVNHRDVQEDVALSSVQTNVCLLRTLAQVQISFRRGDFVLLLGLGLVVRVRVKLDYSSTKRIRHTK